MPCQHQPNTPIENYPFIKRLGEWLERYEALLTFKSLLFTSILFILSGYAISSYLLDRPNLLIVRAVPIIRMGSACVIVITLYFSVVEYLFRNRPPVIRLIQRFIWYLTILLVVTLTGLFAIIFTM